MVQVGCFKDRLEKRKLVIGTCPFNNDISFFPIAPHTIVSCPLIYRYEEEINHRNQLENEFVVTKKVK